MKYKDFVWPVNPSRYSVSGKRTPQYDGDTGKFTALGPVCRTITGEGAFFGSSAYTQFAALQALLADGKSGSLIHPIWGTCTAFLTELSLTQEPRENYVAYRFTFQEADSTGAIPK